LPPKGTVCDAVFVSLAVFTGDAVGVAILGRVVKKVVESVLKYTAAGLPAVGVFTISPYCIGVVSPPSNASRAAILVTRPTANSIAEEVVDGGVPSVATVDAPLSVLKRKFRTKGPVNGFAETTNGLSVISRLTAADLITDTVVAPF
jgi:hypothetical protein